MTGRGLVPPGATVREVRLLLLVNSSASSVTARARVVIQKALSADHDVTMAETSRRGHATRLAQGAGGVFDGPGWQAFVGPGVLLAAIALLAAWIPARRAVRLDPAAVLREP